ncbi:hypothetical protein, partial [Sphingomonas melonis]|uniref:hypothetical protein n=1 Tax=Sphingomonas melonis TaxID=152682 RepID=UPI001C8BD219
GLDGLERATPHSPWFYLAFLALYFIPAASAPPAAGAPVPPPAGARPPAPAAGAPTAPPPATPAR